MLLPQRRWRRPESNRPTPTTGADRIRVQEIPNSIDRIRIPLDPDGTEFMLVFDDGEFSETETLLLSDAMAHLPPEVLSKNFGVAEQALKNLPKQELFIFQAPVPGPLASDREAAAGALGKSPTDFEFRTMQMPPTRRTKGGEVRIIDSSTFKVSTSVAMAMVTVHPGGLRELHWHPTQTNGNTTLPARVG
jgi:oxalate decarboxylase